MKKLKNFTAKEKIAKFDMLYKACREALNAARDDEYDNHYFFEGTIEDVLEVDEKDWEKHNDGKEL